MRQLSDLAGNALSGVHVSLAAVISLSIFTMPDGVKAIEQLRTEARAHRRSQLRQHRPGFA